MNFLALQNAVKSDRFSESQRTDIKLWLNSRYGRVWAMENWGFKTFALTKTLSQGSNTVTTPELQRIYGVWDSSTLQPNPEEVHAVRPEDFYNGTYTSSGYPVQFSVFSNGVFFDRTASSARTLTIVGELKWLALSGDIDIPLIPEEFHFMLVHGASAEGLRLQNDPTWEGFEDDFQRSLAEMKSAYLTTVRKFNDSYPSWPYAT